MIKRDCSVLIISIFYWPEHTGIAPYTTELAEHLSDQEVDVTVLTAMPSYPHWKVHPHYRRKLLQVEHKAGVGIHRHRIYVPQKQSAPRRALYEVSFLSHALTGFFLPRSDAVIGIVPSLSGAVLAAMLAKKQRTNYGLIFQDLVAPATSQSGIQGGDRLTRITSSIERWVAKNAKRIGIVSGGFQPYIESLGVNREQIRRVPNWSRIESPQISRERIRSEFDWSEDSQVILHAGNMGMKQGLEHVIKAARLATHNFPHLRFVLLGDGNQRRKLQRLARGIPNVQFIRSQPEHKFPSILAAADLLLVNERGSVVDMSLPSKLTSYYIAGRPIIAATPSNSLTAKEVRRSKSGHIVAAESPQALLDGIIHLLNHQIILERYAAAGPVYAAKFLSKEKGLSVATEFVHEVANRN